MDIWVALHRIVAIDCGSGRSLIGAQYFRTRVVTLSKFEEANKIFIRFLSTFCLLSLNDQIELLFSVFFSSSRKIYYLHCVSFQTL